MGNAVDGVLSVVIGAVLVLVDDLVVGEQYGIAVFAQCLEPGDAVYAAQVELVGHLSACKLCGVHAHGLFFGSYAANSLCGAAGEEIVVLNLVLGVAFCQVADEGRTAQKGQHLCWPEKPALKVVVLFS